LKTTEIVESLVLDTVQSLGFELCDVEFQKEYGNWVLTLYIDKPGGVTIDDCELVSKAVDPILDEKDPIEQQYYLSVSSLGLDRPLKKDGDYRRNMGNDISVKLYAPFNGKKEYTGRLSAFDDTSLTIETEDGSVCINRKDAASVKPVVTF
jgi:ribosome maturation factor RimP